MEHAALLSPPGRAEARAPRYTSYPPASAFGPAVGPAEMAAWLAAIPPGSAVSAYVHVPFCRRLCRFCACRTQGTQSDHPLRAYVATLEHEIALVAARMPQGVRLSHLHLGGGTPTILSPDLIVRLRDAILSAWPLAEGAEVSVEIDPTDTDPDRVAACARLGMTRASVGVQDFHPAVQDAIGRHQTVEATRDAIAWARDCGARSVNVDMLYGLPGQTEARIAATVDRVLSLGPDRVALYGYAHVPWVSRRQQMIDPADLPGAALRLALFDTAAGLFEMDGYLRVGIDHFALPQDSLAAAAREGRLRRNFQGYTDDTSAVLLGLGASAVSRFPQGYAQNAAATSAHAAAIRDGRLATARGHAFAGEDRARAAAIEELMCHFRLTADRVLAAGGMAPARLEALVAAAQAAFPDVVDRDAQGLAIRPEARPLTRQVAQVFDACEAAPGGHSLAV